MLYSPEQELELIGRIAECKHDPVRFVHFAYPWGQDGTPLAKCKGPRGWQMRELEALAEFTKQAAQAHELGLEHPVYKSAKSSGRGPGKSALLAMVSHWHVSTHIGAQCIISANTETQLRKKTFPEMGRWFTMAINAHWFAIEGMAIEPQRWLAELVKNKLRVDPGYWNVAGQTWSEENPDAFAGAHNSNGLMILFDEASGIPGGVWDTADGFLTDPTPYRYHIAMSQMRRNQGRFYELFHDPRYSHWRRETLNIEGMEGIDQRWVSDFIATHGENSDQVRVEVRGLAPLTDESQLIDTESVQAACANNVPRVHEINAPLIMGVDPAPRGRTVIRFRQGRNARDCCGKDTTRVLNGYDNVQIASEIVRLWDYYKPDAVCVDFGMGTGVIDVLKHQHRRKVVEVSFGSKPMNPHSIWLTRGGELWAELGDWLPGGMIDSEAHPRPGNSTDNPRSHVELYDDLTKRGWEWSGREDNKKVPESKESLHKRGIDSPDDADALALTFAAKPPRRGYQAGATKARIADGVSKSMTD